LNFGLPSEKERKMNVAPPFDDYTFKSGHEKDVNKLNSFESSRDYSARSSVFGWGESKTPISAIRRIVIDSRDRDATQFPFPNSFQVRLKDRINSIKSIELIDTLIPVSSDFPDVPYLLVAFKEFSLLENPISCNNYISSAFARIPINHDEVQGNVQTATSMSWTNSAVSFKKTFDSPFSLSILNVSLLRYDGTNYFTGNEIWTTDWSMMLDVETVVYRYNLNGRLNDFERNEDFSSETLF